MNFLKFWLGLCLLCTWAWARPVFSPRGLVSFEVPENLAQRGASTWGQYPGLVLQMQEQFAPQRELKDFMLELCPTTATCKKSQENLEVEGHEARLVKKVDGAYFSRCLVVRRGGYLYGWSLSSGGQSQEELELIFDRLRQSIRFQADPFADEEALRPIRDPSGQLKLWLPGDFSSPDGRRYSNGKVSLILTSLKAAGPHTPKEFAFRYTPPGFRSYLRREGVEVGSHRCAQAFFTSQDGKLENQMVLVIQGSTAVVLSFMGPIQQRALINLMRESVVGRAQWLQEAKE